MTDNYMKQHIHITISYFVCSLLKSMRYEYFLSQNGKDVTKLNFWSFAIKKKCSGQLTGKKWNNEKRYERFYKYTHLIRTELRYTEPKYWNKKEPILNIYTISQGTCHSLVRYCTIMSKSCVLSKYEIMQQILLHFRIWYISDFSSL